MSVLALIAAVLASAQPPGGSQRVACKQLAARAACPRTTPRRCLQRAPARCAQTYACNDCGADIPTIRIGTDQLDGVECVWNKQVEAIVALVDTRAARTLCLHGVQISLQANSGWPATAAFG